MSLAGWSGMYGERLLQLYGFASQGYAYTDRNNILGESSDGGSFDYREIGVNAFFKYTNRLQMATQFLSRRAGEADDGNLKVDYALVDYRFTDYAKSGLGLRMGRIKNSFGLYNETRDVAFTRESILLPQSIYFERTRDVSLSSDGFELYGHKMTSRGSLALRFMAAYPRVKDENTEFALFRTDRPGDIQSKPSFLARIGYESPNGEFKLFVSSVYMNMLYKPVTGEAGFDSDGDISFQLHILSLRYEYMQWSFTSEYAQRNFRFSKNFTDIPTPPYVPPFMRNTTGESFYLQLVYHFNHKWHLITRYDVLFQNREDRDGTKYVENYQALGLDRSAHTRFAKDSMLGVQWRVNTSWMLSVELHMVDGTGWLSLQDNPDANQTKQNWRAALMSVVYKF